MADLPTEYDGNLKTILSPEEMEKCVKEILDAFFPKLNDELFSKFYGVVETYLYEHHMNLQGRIMEEVFSFICGEEWSKWGDKYKARDLRAKIFEEHREEIIARIPEDLVEENIRLKDRVKFLEELSNSSMHSR